MGPGPGSALLLLLASCVYITAAEHEQRLSELPVDRSDLRLRAIALFPTVAASCEQPTLKVELQVHEDFANETLALRWRFDLDAWSEPLPVTSGAAHDQRADVRVRIPLEALPEARGNCEDDPCEHLLGLHLTATTGETAEITLLEPLVVVPDQPPVVLQQGLISTTDGLTAWDEVASTAAADPWSSVPASTWKTLAIGLTDPLVGEGYEGRIRYDVYGCPVGLEPGDDACVRTLVGTNDGGQGQLPGADVRLATSTSRWATAACSDGSREVLWDFWLRIRNRPCTEEQTIRLSKVGLRLVLDDCDGDGLDAAADCDDDDRTVGEGVPEVCDGEDNDCDGNSDDAGLISLNGTNYSSVAEAIAAASEGDTVSVCAGTWPTGVAPLVDLSVQGIGGRDLVVLDGGGTGSIFDIQGSLDLEGLTLTGGVGTLDGALRGGAVYARAGSVLTVTDCVLRTNTATDGGAIYLDEATGQLTDALVEGNVATLGGGVYMSAGSTLTSVTTDWEGTAANLPSDVYVAGVGTFDFGIDASFVCTGAGCTP